MNLNVLRSILMVGWLEIFKPSWASFIFVLSYGRRSIQLVLTKYIASIVIFDGQGSTSINLYRPLRKKSVLSAFVVMYRCCGGCASMTHSLPLLSCIAAASVVLLWLHSQTLLLYVVAPVHVLPWPHSICKCTLFPEGHHNSSHCCRGSCIPQHAGVI